MHGSMHACLQSTAGACPIFDSAAALVSEAESALQASLQALHHHLQHQGPSACGTIIAADSAGLAAGGRGQGQGPQGKGRDGKSGAVAKGNVHHHQQQQVSVDVLDSGAGIVAVPAWLAPIMQQMVSGYVTFSWGKRLMVALYEPCFGR